MARRFKRFATESLLEWMARHRLPLTRESYLECAYGDPHQQLSAEQEAELPWEFQTPEPEPELIPLRDSDPLELYELPMLTWRVQ